MTDVTQILNAIEQGDPTAAEKLLPLVYEELRVLARQRLDIEKPGQTLQATALVHEAYIRLVDGQSQNWNSRGHFFGAAAQAMRRILVDSARRKMAAKHGGGAVRVEAQLDQFSAAYKPEELLGVDRELDRLSTENPQVSQLVELRYFAGFTMDEAAVEMGISARTAHRYWAYAKAWLRNAIAENQASGQTH